MANPNEIQFFLGSNTKRGFVPLFEQLRDPIGGYRLYILKGGPGSGKSSLMRRVAKKCEGHGHRLEYIPCASDPDSLDAIVDYDASVSILDGTAPHTFDPKYPGAYDSIINLGDAWDQKVLYKNRKRIMELNDIITDCHNRASSCIKAATELLDSNRAAAGAYVNREAVDQFLRQFIDELKACSRGRERQRLLSAVSVGKLVFFDTTLTALCPKLYIIPDEWGAASEVLLSKLREKVLSLELEFITCFCSIRSPDKIDHLLFPSAKTGITTSNSFHAARCDTGVIVEGLMLPMKKADTEAMSGLLTTAQKLIKAAGDYVVRAKLYHDELEAFYITAMDFTKIDTVYNRLINEILNQEPSV